MPPTEPSSTIAADLRDGDTARAILGAALEPAGLALAACRLDSVHHRVGRSLSTVWAATVRAPDGEDHELALVVHHDRRPVPPGAVPVQLPGGAEVHVWRFPNDPYLPGLPSATSPVRVRELLDELGVGPGDVHLVMRAYRPARRAVVEVTVLAPDAAGRVLYLKVLVGDRAARVARVHDELHDHVPVPGVVGVAPAQGILAIRALPGATLRAALVAGDRVPAPTQVVALAGRFADADLRSGTDPTRFADPSRHVELLADLVPDLRPELEELAGVAATVDGPRVPVHGDLHDAQLLVDDLQVTGVLDVDGAGTGLLAHDAGNLVAHLEVLDEVWPQAGHRTRAYAEEVRDAYRVLLDPADLARGAVAGWLGLATGPYRAQDPGWEASTRRRIARAAAWAARAG